MSFATQEPKDYDVIIIPSRLKDDFRWIFCENCGHRLIGAYIDKVVDADTGVYRNVETSYTIRSQCQTCHSIVRIVLASEVN
jgi:uncharacterized UPF0146 family protein